MRLDPNSTAFPKTNPPLIKCECCDGTGKVKLPPEYWLTLKRLSESSSPISAKLLRPGSVTSNAMGMRLFRMESLGLIRRVGKSGKFILWEAVKV